MEIIVAITKIIHMFQILFRQCIIQVIQNHYSQEVRMDKGRYQIYSYLEINLNTIDVVMIQTITGLHTDPRIAWPI
jgi:hypothetical protein